MAGNAAAKEDVRSISAERIGFRAIAGEHKLRLLQQPWPEDSQPAASASLLSVASRKGLIAAAGPNTLVVGSTTDARNALIGNAQTPNKLVDFAPESSISVPRVSQVAFSSDENCLVIAAEQGGGLAVYDTNQRPMKEPLFQIATNGVGVQQLLPNPNPAADFSYYFGVVLETGQLLVADLKERKLVATANGNVVFLENVSCAAWSRLGKQIVAGRTDGTAAQVDPQGNIKAEIPLPPQLRSLAEPDAVGYPLTSVYWLETLDFLFIHSPSYAKSDSNDSMGDTPRQDSLLHLVHRNKADNNYEFQTVPDPLPPGMLDRRVPARHFIQRLKDWPPDLEDTLMMVSTIASEVGIMTKSRTPLDKASENATAGVFTTTSLIDGRGAPLPLSVVDEMSETTAIGMAVDLSATLANTAKILRPIPGDEEFEESPVPLPALCLLNNEGILSVWWVMYDESLYKKATYPGMAFASGVNPATPPGTSNTTSTSTFGTTPASMNAVPQRTILGGIPAFGTSIPFGQAAQKPQPPSTFRSSSAFGEMFKGQNTFGTASSFGSPSPFGQMSQQRPAQTSMFGATSSLGQGSSLGGAPTLGTTSSPPDAASTAGVAANTTKHTFGTSSSIGSSVGFGHVGGMGANKASVWGSSNTPQLASTVTATKTFGSDASTKSSFADLDSKANDTKLASVTTSWGSSTPKASPFSQVRGGQASNLFGVKPSLAAEPSGSTASFASGFSFGSGSTVAPFGTPSLNSSFGKPSQTREETMDDDGSTERPEDVRKEGSGLLALSEKFKLGSTFKGDGSAKEDLANTDHSVSSLFGKPGSFLSGLDVKQDSTVLIKQEPGTQDSPTLNDVPEEPAPVERSTTFHKASGTVSTAEPPVNNAQRFANDIPPMEVPGDQLKPAILEADPFSYKAKRFVGDLPPMDVPVESSEKAAEELGKKAASEAPVAGSPPIDLGNERFSDAAASDVELPEEDEEEWDEEDEEGESEAESDDVEQSDGHAEGEDTTQVTDPKALSAFEARLTPASPHRQDQSAQSTTPATDKKMSFTPAGFPDPPMSFAPMRNQESPRSPSPQRRSPQRASAFRSVTSPMPPTSKYGRSSVAPAYTSAQPLPTQTQKIVVPPARPLERQPLTQPAEPESGDLEDDEDARLLEILETKAEPSKEVPEFLAHQGFAGQVGKEGLGGTIEKVFVDINSMITTLGWNARSLQSFVDGHMELRKSGERGRDDLEDPDAWVIDEVEALALVQDVLEATLEEGKLEDPVEKVESLREQESEVSRVRAKTVDIRKRLAAHTDVEQRTLQHAAPLSIEAESQQSELRQGVQQVQKLLTQIEDAMTLLRADLSSVAATDTSNVAKNVPTVEAVTNTILKMTAMIEKKSGDIDVLESQIRRLPNGMVSLNLDADYEDDLVGALRGSRLVNNSSRTTPRGQRPRMAANGDPLGMSGMFDSRMRTPPTSRRSVMFSPEASALGKSTGSLNGSARKKMRDATDKEIDEYEAKISSRAEVLRVLRQGIERKGSRVVRLG